MKTGRNGKGSVGNPDFEDVSSYSPLKRGKKKEKAFLCLKLCLALVCVCLIGAGSPWPMSPPA